MGKVWGLGLEPTNLRYAAPSDPDVAVLLDQEKANDRINPAYLVTVLHQFGFPASLAACISHLFFSTRISVSINGWLGSPFTQGRGLRQGDPLSPLLFNLAFEPLLRTILACSQLQGVAMSPHNRPPLAKQIERVCSQIPLYLSHDFLRNSTDPPKVKLLSYADDLEIFLSSPEEWPVPLSLLSLYGKASNAKVNLSKMVLVSLSGQCHESWSSLAEQSSIEWYDESSTGSVRYLGYPLYHTQAQLDHFLDAIKIKIQRHCNMLQQRNLSIHGKSVVANSLLLSRLWHILCVMVVPSQWLTNVKRIIRQYIVSFWPGVAWDTLCLPRKHGGIGLVDIEDQYLALHMVYVQRLLRPRSSVDFLSPWLIHSFRIYTGHASVLLLLMYPDTFVRRLRRIPHLAHLARLIRRLPALLPSSEWPSWWFLDLPWANVCSVTPSASSVTALSLIPSNCLLVSLLTALPDTNILSSLPLPRASSLHHVLDILCPPVGPSILQISPPIRSLIAFTVAERHYRLDSRNHLSPTVPSFTHWFIDTSPRSRKTIAQLPIGALRRYWHPAAAQLRGPVHPPIRRPLHLMLPPRVWREFWSLSLPAKAFTPWWRLLHDRLSVRSRLHALNLSSFPSPLCALCDEATEDVYHMVIGCYMKSNFWFEVVAHLGLVDDFLADDAIWIALTTLQDKNGSPLDLSILELLGTAFYTLWKFHWRCVLDNVLWQSQIIFESFLAENGSLISSFLDIFESRSSHSQGQALTPGPALFTFPNKTFDHRTAAYRVIQEQISVDVQFRPLSLYHQKPNGDFLVEAKFDTVEDTKRAIHTGITYKEAVYKTTAFKDNSEGKLTHTQMTMVRMPNMYTFLEDLLHSLKYYDKVYQAKKYNIDDFFEDHASFMIDTTVSCTVREEVQPLSRLFFLSSWDVYVPDTYRSAPPSFEGALQDDETSKTNYREANYNTEHIDDKVNDKVPGAAPIIQDILEQQTQLKDATAAAAAATASICDSEISNFTSEELLSSTFNNEIKVTRPCLLS